MVLFSAPWCGYCKQAAPAWSRAAETLSPLIPFYNVDCDEDANKGFCASEGVKGYPTIKVRWFVSLLSSKLTVLMNGSFVGLSPRVKGRWKGLYRTAGDQGYGGLRDGLGIG